MRLKIEAGKSMAKHVFANGLKNLNIFESRLGNVPQATKKHDRTNQKTLDGASWNQVSEPINVGHVCCRQDEHVAKLTIYNVSIFWHD